jgi:hypothetical protein
VFRLCLNLFFFLGVENIFRQMTVFGYFTDLTSMLEFLFQLLAVVVSVLVTVRHLSFIKSLKIKEINVINII